ncbi:unnamed protein product [Ceratitis capitata]|uniref:(Mediterranean fruit fly) hypothetical protein n=1 Tax=Ceratitis capitata TaxID=7213 RepID=A0A811UZF0_CERCA|nr:unnamed protein product [Ceratitis capitata]
MSPELRLALPGVPNCLFCIKNSEMSVSAGTLKPFYWLFSRTHQLQHSIFTFHYHSPTAKNVWLFSATFMTTFHGSAIFRPAACGTALNSRRKTENENFLVNFPNWRTRRRRRRKINTVKKYGERLPKHNLPCGAPHRKRTTNERERTMRTFIGSPPTNQPTNIDSSRGSQRCRNTFMLHDYDNIPLFLCFAKTMHVCTCARLSLAKPSRSKGGRHTPTLQQQNTKSVTNAINKSTKRRRAEYTLGAGDEDKGNSDNNNGGALK